MHRSCQDLLRKLRSKRHCRIPALSDDIEKLCPEKALIRTAVLPLSSLKRIFDSPGKMSTTSEAEESLVNQEELLAIYLQRMRQRFKTEVNRLTGGATLFNAVHVCLGHLDEDGAGWILARQRKDLPSHALHRFDTQLLDLYAEVRPDLEQRIEQATGPHHLFHMLTEEPQVRLHMTRRLIDSA